MATPRQPLGLCKVCALTIEQRFEVDSAMRNGDSVASIYTRLLAGAFGFTPSSKISEDVLRRHKAEHLVPLTQVEGMVHKTRVAESLSFGEVVKVKATIDGLDEVFGMAHEVANHVKDKLLSGEDINMPEAMVFKWMLVEMRESIKTKHELNHGTKLTIETDGLFGLLALGHAKKVPGIGPGGSIDDDGPRHRDTTTEATVKPTGPQGSVPESDNE